MANRIKDINPECKVHIISEFLTPDSIPDLLKNNFDCIIPVSGGKDSVWQVYQCLKYGLTPLAITYKSPGRNIYGDYNLKGLINLGVDHIDYTINPKVESYFMLKTFKEKGSTAIPMHLSIFNLPIILAKKLNIPLIVYGENPASEYGFGEKKFKKNINKVDKIWIKKYASLNNTDSNYWKDSFLENKKMFSYDLKIFPKNLKILFLIGKTPSHQISLIPPLHLLLCKVYS